MALNSNGGAQRGILIALGVVVTLGVLGAVLSRDPINSTQILGFCGVVTVSLLALLHQVRTSAKIETTATNVEQALHQTNLKRAEELAQLKENSEKTLGWVNSAMGTQLERTAISERRLADITKSPSDIQMAKESAARYTDHMTQQRVEDRKEAQGTTVLKEAAVDLRKSSSDMKEEAVGLSEAAVELKEAADELKDVNPK